MSARCEEFFAQQREAERLADYEVTKLAERWRERQGGDGSWGHRMAVHVATAEAIATEIVDRPVRS